LTYASDAVASQDATTPAPAAEGATTPAPFAPAPSPIAAFAGGQTVAGEAPAGLTKVTAAAPINAFQVQVESIAGFQNGMYAVFDAMSGTPQTLRISAIQTIPTNQFVLETPLAFAIPAGAVVERKPEASYQMSSHESSSYGKSSGSLASSDSSFGSSMTSSDSITGSSAGSSGSMGGSSGSLNGKTGSITGSLVSSFFSTFGSFLLALCFACCYKSRVIDNPEPGIGHLSYTNKEWHQWDNQHGGIPDFEHHLCDCVKEPSICCMSVFCPMVRIAHTNEAADVCGYWETFISMWCASLCVVGPLCLNVYFRFHVKEALGIHQNWCCDVIQAFFCLPCVTGQQAITVDEAMGYKFQCPFTMTRIPIVTQISGVVRDTERSCARNCF